MRPPRCIVSGFPIHSMSTHLPTGTFRRPIESSHPSREPAKNNRLLWWENSPCDVDLVQTSYRLSKKKVGQCWHREELGDPWRLLPALCVKGGRPAQDAKKKPPRLTPNRIERLTNRSREHEEIPT